MKHYEERLQHDLDHIRGRLRRVGLDIQEGLKMAVRAVLTRDRSLASKTILGDHPINRTSREIDALCHAFVARHLPSARHLRFVSSVLRLNVSLERIGDYAVTIAREAVQLSEEPPTAVARDIELMAEQSLLMLSQALQSFDQGDDGLARGTQGMAEQIDGTHEKVLDDLLAEGDRGRRPIKDLFALLVIFNRLERVSDQAKNICEETTFVATGETKPPKVYRILFVDEGNGHRSQMAEAFARKAFPESGVYTSAGWDPVERIDDAFQEFMAARGHDLSEIRPKRLEPARELLDDYHVIVSLAGDPFPHIPEIPFSTAVLVWDVGPRVTDLARDQTTAQLEESYKQIAVQVRELMETLRGEGAA